jgi:hypothetical protein
MFQVPADAAAGDGGGLVTNAPSGLVEHVAAVFWSTQQQLARQMRLIARMHEEVGSDRAEFVGDDLAAAFCLHPITGTDLTMKAVVAARLDGLLDGMEAMEITDRHVHAVTGELGRWSLEHETAQQIVTRVLTRTREWVAAGRGTRSWPTPGELRRKIRAAVLLHDAQAAKKARDKAVHDRSAELFQSGVGEATLSVSGPEAVLLRMWAAVEARAQALGELPGDERTLSQRLFDAAEELLSVDADVPGERATSAVPTKASDGALVQVWVRGVQVQLVVPYAVTEGLDTELAEVPGYGPVLPATARELMAGASSLQRVAVDSGSARLIGVDDRVPMRPGRAEADTAPDHEAIPLFGEHDSAEPAVDQPSVEAEVPRENSPDEGEPDERAPDEPPAEDPPTGDQADQPWPSPAQAARRRIEQLPPMPEPPPPPRLPEPEIPSELLRAIRELVNAPLPTPPAAEDHYRPSGRLARHINVRDRWCTFPGCPRPAVRCDRDHRVPYPLGATSEQNLHALCRRHHRAKQLYFTVTLDPGTGDTVWRTPDGREYRRPPPDY